MNKIIFLGILLFSLTANSQLFGFLNPIDSDRPGQAYSAKTVGLTSIQLQSGFTYSHYSFGNVQFRTFSEATSIRLGLLPRFELNSTFYWANHALKNQTSDYAQIAQGFLSPELGCRINFLKGDKWKPSLAIQSNLVFRSDKGDFQKNELGSNFTLATRNAFNKFTFNTNLKMDFFGGGIAPEYSYVGNIYYQISSKFSCFVEAYGSISNSDVDMDAGFTYLATKNLLFDLFGGWNLNTTHPGYFIEAGVSWKINILEKIIESKLKNVNVFGIN